MKYYLGLGSNLGDRKANLSRALDFIEKIEGVSLLKISSLYENPALVPEGTSKDWHKPFFNLATLIECSLDPLSLLSEVKRIEKEMGREFGERWAPRVIDIDLLLWEGGAFTDDKLEMPHPGLLKRSFVMSPLIDLDPLLKVNSVSLLREHRQSTGFLPQWMGITNVTPDSFSDGKLIESVDLFLERLSDWSNEGVQIIDLGAESTRPGAEEIEAQEEWKRLEPYIEAYADFKKDYPFCPQLSIDTRKPFVAERAIESGVSYINNVSGADEEILEVIKDSSCQYVFMHSLSVPADPEKVFSSSASVIDELKLWVDQRFNVFEKKGIKKERLIFDPGIGFGKTSWQSLDIIKNIESLLDDSIRIAVGHSRKSFIKNFSSEKSQERDMESLGLSLLMASKGVDIIRVHEPVLHMKAFRGWSHGI